MTERILVIINTIDAGGAETFVMRLFRCLYKEVVFDFLINKKDSDFYFNEICNLGGKVYCGTPKSRNLLKSFLGVYRTVKSGKYKKILCISVHPIGWLDLLAARLAGAEMRLVRSTNSKSGGKCSFVLAKLCRPLIRQLSTVMLAPSKEAGAWLFGFEAVQKGQVYIMKNGIQTRLYTFDQAKRIRTRNELAFDEDFFVIGHIGRFSKQKNHEKLINVFKEVVKRNNNSRLLLIGDGERIDYIREKVRELGLESVVFFLGIRDDTPALLMAMDCFVFPSFYEGMPNAVIEAQAVGLPCIVSNAITMDVKISDTVQFLDINAGDEGWADAICKQRLIKRTEAISSISACGYAIENAASCFKEILQK